MKVIGIIVSVLVITLSACAPINTQFSCNQTAGDHCLSIEEVNAMTAHVDKDVPLSGVECATCNDTKQAIWFAPWKAQDGSLHPGEVLFAQLSRPMNEV